MRILVTSTRNPFALDLVRKLASQGHQVVAADTYGGAIGSHSRYLLAHEVTASPRFETSRFIADVAAIVERHGIELIVPTFEEAFYLAARRAELPASVTLYTGEFAQLARLHDKASFQRLATDVGVPVPDTIVATDDATLRAAIDRFGSYFARAAFSRGGVALLTNTGPLASAMTVDACHPTPEQPWLVQPFVDGDMVCTYSTVHEGRVTSHCAYRALEQWAHSTSIAFRSDDAAPTLEHVEAIAAALGYTGQLSFDFVDHGGTLLAIECNPRSTDGIVLMTPEQVTNGITGPDTPLTVVPEGETAEITAAVVLEAFREPLRHLPEALEHALRVRDLGSGWHDARATMWAPATLIHGAKLARGNHEAALAALAEDIVWNGEPIEGMSEADATALADVHAGRA